MSYSEVTITSNAADTLPEKSPLLILVDGHSLARRSYHALAKRGLKTSTGIPTSVCFGFLKSLKQVIASQHPQAMALAFDLGLPTFRHEADNTYKADRPETPEDFITDLKNLHDLLDALNLKPITAPGYEADDVLATLAEQGAAAGYRVKIVTGDRDLFQLIDPARGISVLYLETTFWQRSGNTGLREFGPEQVKEKMGITPEQVVDYKALCGDTSDNIPGIKGIGDKTAVKLLQDYGSLDQIYASLEEIKGTLKTKLENGKEEAYRSQHLAKLVRDVPEVNLEDCQLKGFDEEVLKPLLLKLQLKSFLQDIKQLQQAFGGVVDEDKPPETPVTEEDEELGFYTFEETQAAQERSHKSQITPRIIDTTEKLQELVSELQTYTNPVAWDTETTDLEPRNAELVGIGCCWGTLPTDMAYIPLGHKTGGNLNKAEALAALRPILESDKYPKSLQNAKFDRLVLRCQGIKLAGVVFDTMLASYILNSEASHNLSELSKRYLGLTAKSYAQLVPKGKNIADLDIPTVADYCGMDVYATYQLVPKLSAELEASPKLYQLLLEVEQPVEPVLAEMEFVGIRVDAAYLNSLSQEMEKDLKLIEQRAYDSAGEKFNLGSPKQLSKLLFETFNLDTKKSRKIKTGYSTDAGTLERLQEGKDPHPLVDAVVEYRTLSKLKSTYVDALPKLIHPDTQRVHTDFNQTVTATGRLSSSNPNLQNIPIRTAFSRQIRKAFVPEAGWLMVAADYSQIELRILAHLSQEPVLIDAYKNNQDVHNVTARLLFEKEEVTADERRFAKTINFGVIYGMGALRFSQSTGVNKTKADEFIKRFNQRYPRVFEYLQQVKKEALANGYVETILGRRRYFNFEGGSLRNLQGSKPDEIKLEQLRTLGQTDAQLLRAAANAPIQGSSADIIKIAMVKLHQILPNYHARLLLQVHDELVFEVPPDEWEELQPQIRSTMENAVQLSVPLVVDVHTGQNWMETK